MKCRIAGGDDWKPVRPRIAVMVGDKEYEYNSLFCDPNRLQGDLEFLSSIWFDLLPDEDMHIGQKELEIAQYLGGKRGAGKVLEIIHNLFLNS